MGKYFFKLQLSHFYEFWSKTPFNTDEIEYTHYSNYIENIINTTEQVNVVAVGKGTKEEPITVSVGDNILYGKYAGTELKYNGTDYLIMKESDILAIIK